MGRNRRGGQKKNKGRKQGGRKKQAGTSSRRKPRRQMVSLPGPLESKVWTYLREAKRRPVGIRELGNALQLSQREQRLVRRYLKVQARDNRLQQVRGCRFFVPDPASRPEGAQGDLLQGVLSIQANGHGLVELEEGGRVFVPERYLEGALHGDGVAVRRLPPRDGSRSAVKVVAIEEPFVGRLIGRVQIVDGTPYLEPEQRQYPMILLKGRAGAKPEQWVVARLQRELSDPTFVMAEVEGILEEQANGEIPAHIRGAALLDLDRFPTAVLEEAEAVAVAPGEAEREGRLDLREMPLVTIDGADARDFDDAVCCTMLPDGRLQLLVAVADVAHYVRLHSALDQEALRRGTSVYFPSFCIPMLPESLSNGICSLKPDEERLCMVVRMVIDGDQLCETELREAVMHSHARLTYEQVEEVIAPTLDQEASKDADDAGNVDSVYDSGASGDAGVVEAKTEEVSAGDAPQEGENPALAFREQLVRMARLAVRLRERRMARGAVDFDFPEPKVVFDDEGTVSDIIRAERLRSHRLIEEFMLLANEVVAGYFLGRELPTIFRVHPEPAEEKIAAFVRVLQLFGVDLSKLSARQDSHREWDVAPGFLSELLEKSAGNRAERLLHHLLLRAMMRASYAVENIGHFGLASMRYLHFTSPIRRLADLWVHRLLKASLHGESVFSDEDDALEELEEVAEEASRRERIAMDAEREVMQRHRASFMEQRIGEEFSGIIASVAPFGFFVELDDHFVEGLVHMRNLDGEFEFNEEQLCLVDARQRLVYRPGDRVRIEVLSASPEQGEIDFALREHQSCITTVSSDA